MSPPFEIASAPPEVLCNLAARLDMPTTTQSTVETMPPGDHISDITQVNATHDSLVPVLADSFPWKPMAPAAPLEEPRPYNQLANQTSNYSDLKISTGPASQQASCHGNKKNAKCPGNDGQDTSNGFQPVPNNGCHGALYSSETASQSSGLNALLECIEEVTQQLQSRPATPSQQDMTSFKQDMTSSKQDMTSSKQDMTSSKQDMTSSTQEVKSGEDMDARNSSLKSSQQEFSRKPCEKSAPSEHGVDSCQNLVTQTVEVNVDQSALKPEATESATIASNCGSSSLISVGTEGAPVQHSGENIISFDSASSAPHSESSQSGSECVRNSNVSKPNEQTSSIGGSASSELCGKGKNRVPRKRGLAKREPGSRSSSVGSRSSRSNAKKCASEAESIIRSKLDHVISERLNSGRGDSDLDQSEIRSCVNVDHSEGTTDPYSIQSESRTACFSQSEKGTEPYSMGQSEKPTDPYSCDQSELRTDPGSAIRSEMQTEPYGNQTEIQNEADNCEQSESRTHPDDSHQSGGGLDLNNVNQSEPGSVNVTSLSQAESEAISEEIERLSETEQNNPASQLQTTSSHVLSTPTKNVSETKESEPLPEVHPSSSLVGSTPCKSSEQLSNPGPQLTSPPSSLRVRTKAERKMYSGPLCFSSESSQFVDIMGSPGKDYVVRMQRLLDDMWENQPLFLTDQSQTSVRSHDSDSDSSSSQISDSESSGQESQINSANHKVECGSANEGSSRKSTNGNSELAERMSDSDEDRTLVSEEDSVNLMSSEGTQVYNSEGNSENTDSARNNDLLDGTATKQNLSNEGSSKSSEQGCSKMDIAVDSENPVSKHGPSEENKDPLPTGTADNRPGCDYGVFSDISEPSSGLNPHTHGVLPSGGLNNSAAPPGGQYTSTHFPWQTLHGVTHHMYPWTAATFGGSLLQSEASNSLHNNSQEISQPILSNTGTSVMYNQQNAAVGGSHVLHNEADTIGRTGKSEMSDHLKLREMENHDTGEGSRLEDHREPVKNSCDITDEIPVKSDVSSSLTEAQSSSLGYHSSNGPMDDMDSPGSDVIQETPSTQGSDVIQGAPSTQGQPGNDVIQEIPSTQEKHVQLFNNNSELVNRNNSVETSVESDRAARPVPNIDVNSPIKLKISLKLKQCTVVRSKSREKMALSDSETAKVIDNSDTTSEPRTPKSFRHKVMDKVMDFTPPSGLKFTLSKTGLTPSSQHPAESCEGTPKSKHTHELNIGTPTSTQPKSHKDANTPSNSNAWSVYSSGGCKLKFSASKFSQSGLSISHGTPSRRAARNASEELSENSPLSSNPSNNRPHNRQSSVKRKLGLEPLDRLASVLEDSFECSSPLTEDCDPSRRQSKRRRKLTYEPGTVRW